MKRDKNNFLLIVGILLLAGLLIIDQGIAAETYQIDPVHSSVGFSVKHLTVSTVTGEFRDFSGTIQFDPVNPAAFMAEANIKAASIDTRQPKRDEHLRSADFFDAEHNPQITFKSNTIKKTDAGYEIVGDLTIRGTTKQVAIPVTISDPVKTPQGNEVIGLEGGLTINRQDYGVSWNQTADNGAIAGNEVKITIEIEAKKT